MTRLCGPRIVYTAFEAVSRAKASAWGLTPGKVRLNAYYCFECNGCHLFAKARLWS